MLKYISTEMKKIYILLLAFAVIAALSLSFLIGKKPVEKLHEIAALVAEDSVFMTKYPAIYDAVDLSEDIREKAKAQALLAQSQSDSIQLILNLRDSSIFLVIKGVIIHTTKLQSFSIDPVLYNLTNREYLWLFGKPQNITQLRTTIVKEPIVVREAPKDTLEAALNAYKPDTLIQNPAMLHFSVQADIIVKMVQSEAFTDWEQQIADEFESTLVDQSLFEKYRALFSRNKQKYLPKITLILSRDDLRAIYRALPANATVVVVI